MGWDVSGEVVFLFLFLFGWLGGYWRFLESCGRRSLSLLSLFVTNIYPEGPLPCRLE